MKYLIYRVGCIECGVESAPIATTYTLAKAIQKLRYLPDIWGEFSGDGFYTIVDLENCCEVYREHNR